MGKGGIMSGLTHTLAADELGMALIGAIEKYRPELILEIGSSDGTGSTKVIAETTEAEIYCLELDPERFESLVLNTSEYDNIHCFNLPSVGIDGMMTMDEVIKFSHAHRKFNVWAWMGMKEVKKWWTNTHRTLRTAEIPNGIEHIKEHFGIDTFDLVFIDGGAFTGLAEVKAVLGAKVIILDDVMDLKCYDAYQYLKGLYELEYENLSYRNGFAVFVNKEYANS